MLRRSSTATSVELTEVGRLFGDEHGRDPGAPDGFPVGVGDLLSYRWWDVDIQLNSHIPFRGGYGMEFPEHLRSMRKEARLSQRALAERVGVDFTYLSKIENGRVEPPSETVLKKIAKELAGVLGQDETELADELITLAGKIPSDLAETLARNPQAVQFLRSIGDDVRSPAEWQRLIRGRSQEQE